MELLNRLSEPYRFLAWAFVMVAVLGVLLWIMLTLPGHTGNMCRVGGNMTLPNLVFAVVFAGLLSAQVVLVPLLFAGSSDAQQKLPTWLAGVPVLGTILGIFTVFCTICTLPIFVLFGASLSLGFFTTYSVYIQIASVVLMLASLFFLNRYLTSVCATCRL